MAQKKKSDLFQAINCINYKTKPDFDISKVNGYILSLWLAQDKDLVKYVQEINPYIFNMNNKMIFKFYYNRVPKGRRFIKWTKKDDIKNSDEVEKLCKEYNISPREAKLSVY